MDKWEKINAYVDGELYPPETAEVAQMASEDPEVAKLIARLTHLKSTLSMLNEPFESEIKTSKKNLGYWQAIGTGLLLTLSLYIFNASKSLDQSTFFDSLKSYHSGWSDTVNDFNNTARIVSTKSAKNLSPPPFDIPDLSELGLILINNTPIENSAIHGWHLGYLGKKGCRISLFITEKTEKLDKKYIEEGKFTIGQSTFYAWHSSSKHYFLVASLMKDQRLVVIHDALQLKTRRKTNNNGQMIALQHAYQNAESCTS